MQYKEVVERGFFINQDGVIYDENGNEWRNEGGRVEFIKTVGVSKQQLQTITKQV